MKFRSSSFGVVPLLFETSLNFAAVSFRILHATICIFSESHFLFAFFLASLNGIIITSDLVYHASRKLNSV